MFVLKLINLWLMVEEFPMKNERSGDMIINFFTSSTGGFYIATRPYTAITHTEHSFETGAVFQVVEKHKEGWWKAL